MNPTEKQAWRQAISSGVRSGTVAAITSTIALSICGWVERRRPAAPSNGPSQWLWGTQAAYETRATLSNTAVGYVIHHAMSILWSVLHERAFQKLNQASIWRPIAAGLTTAAIAAFVDYRLVPERFQPGFDKHLCRKSLVAVYAAFGVGLALRTALRATSRRSRLDTGFSRAPATSGSSGLRHESMPMRHGR